MTDDLGNLTYEDFATRAGRTIKVGDGADLVSLELIGAERAKGDRQDQAFSVLFRGPDDSFLPQSTYLLDLDELGTQPIFLVPISRDSDGFVYEAVFTRMTN